MKEIIYVQAGRLANHIGTHFWNTQESYFTYGEDEEPDVDHDVSFREGLTLKVSFRSLFPEHIHTVDQHLRLGIEGRINVLS